MTKRMSIALALVIWNLTCMAQKVLKAEMDPNTADITEVIEYGKTKTELFNAAREWISSNVTNYQQKRISEDETTGTIKYSCTEPLYSVKVFHNNNVVMKGNFTYVTTVTVKDGRFRIKTTNCTATWNEQLLGQWGAQKQLPAMKFVLWSQDKNALTGIGRAVDVLATGICNTAKAAKVDDDF